jgi:hypothetical protein
MGDSDASYYQQRAEAEARRAEKAQHPKAAAAHLRLAELYVARINGVVVRLDIIHD